MDLIWVTLTQTGLAQIRFFRKYVGAALRGHKRASTKARSYGLIFHMQGPPFVAYF